MYLYNIYILYICTYITPRTHTQPYRDIHHTLTLSEPQITLRVSPRPFPAEGTPQAGGATRGHRAPTFGRRFPECSEWGRGLRGLRTPGCGRRDSAELRGAARPLRQVSAAPRELRTAGCCLISFYGMLFYWIYLLLFFLIFSLLVSLLFYFFPIYFNILCLYFILLYNHCLPHRRGAPDSGGEQHQPLLGWVPPGGDHPPPLPFPSLSRDGDVPGLSTSLQLGLFGDRGFFQWDEPLQLPSWRGEWAFNQVPKVGGNSRRWPRGGSGSSPAAPGWCNIN